MDGIDYEEFELAMDTLAESTERMAKSPVPPEAGGGGGADGGPQAKELGNGSVFMTESLNLYKGLLSVRSSLNRMTNNAEQQRILPAVPQPYKSTRHPVVGVDGGD